MPNKDLLCRISKKCSLSRDLVSSQRFADEMLRWPLKSGSQISRKLGFSLIGECCHFLGEHTVCVWHVAEHSENEKAEFCFVPATIHNQPLLEDLELRECALSFRECWFFWFLNSLPFFFSLGSLGNLRKNCCSGKSHLFLINNGLPLQLPWAGVTPLIWYLEVHPWRFTSISHGSTWKWDLLPLSS